MRDRAKRREAGHPSRESLLTVWVSEAAAARDPRDGAFREAANTEEYVQAHPWYLNHQDIGTHELGHLATNSTKEKDAEKAARYFRRRLKTARKQKPRLANL
jgi:hypothetical protein